MSELCFCCLNPIQGPSHEGLHPACFEKWFGVDTSYRFDRLSKKFYVSEHSEYSFQNPKWKKIATSRFDGLFPKRLAKWERNTTS